MANEIHGDVFIVPTTYTINENGNIVEFYQTNEVSVRGEKIVPRENDIFVQIWCTCEGHSDWQSHSTPSFSTDECWGQFPEFIPVQSLDGLREGDSFTLSFRGRVFRLTCRQNVYKYYKFGSFQRALKYLMQRRVAG